MVWTEWGKPQKILLIYTISAEKIRINLHCGHNKKATKAQESGRLAEEIVKVEIPQRKGDPVVFDKDEFIKPTTTIEVLAKLRPAFRKEGSVTAGNASGMNDGAAALILASEEAVKKYGLKTKSKDNRICSCRSRAPNYGNRSGRSNSEVVKKDSTFLWKI